MTKISKYLPAFSVIISSLLILAIGTYTASAAPSVNILGNNAVVGLTATTSANANLTVSSSLAVTGLASGGTYAVTPDSNGKFGTTTLSSGVASSSFTQGTGMSITHSGGSTTWTNTGATSFATTSPLYAVNSTGTVTLSCPTCLTNSAGANKYVESLIGTANQISVSSATGTITLTTPQDIAAASSPTFAGLTLSGVTSGFVKVSNAGVLTTSTISLTADVSGVLPVANGGTGTTSIPKSFGAVIDRPASADSIYDLKFFTEAATLTKLACLSRNGTTTLAINRHPVNSLTTTTIVSSIICGVTTTASTTSFSVSPTSETWTSFEILTTAGTPSSTAITLYYTQ